MIKHILVDMDGVMSNFFASAMEVWKDKVPQNFSSEDWECPEIDGMISNILGISEREFWDKINLVPTFWENLEPYPWLNELVSFLNSTKLPWTVATSPNKDPSCPTGKIKWLRKYIGSDFKSYMIGSKKELMANPYTILLDDTPKKIKAFNDAGGVGILWPAPWNKLSDIKEPLPYIKKLVYNLIE